MKGSDTAAEGHRRREVAPSQLCDWGRRTRGIKLAGRPDTYTDVQLSSSLGANADETCEYGRRPRNAVGTHSGVM